MLAQIIAQLLCAKVLSRVTRISGHNDGAVGADPIGDHEEANCSSLAGAPTSTHNELARGLAEYLRECRFANVRLEVTEWDPGDTEADPTARRARATPSNGFNARRSTRPNPTKRVPDVLCTSPDGLTDYVIDCRISWNIQPAAYSMGNPIL